MAVTVTDSVCAELEPQELFAVTDMFPLDAEGVTVIEFVFDDPVHPEGSVHVYVVAPLTATILYVWDDPWQTELLPDIAPG